MEEPLCQIEITQHSSGFKAKVQSNKGRYVEFENQDIEYLLEMIYDDIQMEIEEDYW
ncbi:MAG: hypothetical protein ACOC5D_06955 [Thermoplasmatota archaeon]